MVVADYWGYEGWNILAVAASWSSGQIIMLLIPIFLGLTASAVVAAILNLYRPISLLMQSLGVIILPTFSTWVHHGIPVSEVKQRVTKIALFFGGVVALYGFILTILAKPLLHLLYAGKYDEHWILIGLIGLMACSSIISNVFISALKAFNLVKHVVHLYLISVIIIVTLFYPLVMLLGLVGVLLLGTLSYVTICLIAYSKLKKV